MPHKKGVPPSMQQQPVAVGGPDDVIRGSTLNGVIGPLDTVRTWQQGQARNPHGYLITNGEHWARIFEAVRLCLDNHLYEGGDQQAQDELRASLSEVMRAFRYDEDPWQQEGLIYFDESMVPEKYRSKGKRRQKQQHTSQRIAVGLYIFNEKNDRIAEALCDLYGQEDIPLPSE